MKLMLLTCLLLACISQQTLGNPARVGQTPLIVQDDQYDAFLYKVSSPSVSVVDSLSDFIMTSLTNSQREDLILKLWQQHDVVDVMKMTGHGDGLEEDRLVQVFGECSPRMYVQ
jgi:leucyl aminopeptidase